MRIGLVRGECSKSRQNLSDDVAYHVLQRLRKVPVIFRGQQQVCLYL